MDKENAAMMKQMGIEVDDIGFDDPELEALNNELIKRVVSWSDVF